MNRETYWKRQLAGLHDSGLSVAEYCRREGIKENTLHYWKSRLATEGKFTRVTGGAAIEIELANGVRLRLPVDTAQEILRTVLEAVNAIGC